MGDSWEFFEYARGETRRIGGDSEGAPAWAELSLSVGSRRGGSVTNEHAYETVQNSALPALNACYRLTAAKFFRKKYSSQVRTGFPTKMKPSGGLFRALGENFLYDAWDHDILAVSDYVKVNPRTLEKYIRRSYEKYRPV